VTKDYYSILGVSPTAGAGAIKQAYRRLALIHHPDRNQDDPQHIARFQECTEAYQVLMDPERRRLYDLYGIEWSRNELDDHNELEGLFGSVTRLFEGLVQVEDQGGAPSPDLYSEVEITLEEAALGASADIQVDVQEPCAHCASSRDKAAGPTKPCPRCRGKGRVVRTQGLVNLSTTCPDCQGSGQVSAADCPVCGGKRVVTLVRELKVRVPPGIHHGQYLRVKGGGQPRPTGGRGELYVKVRIQPHAVFRRHQDDLIRQLALKPSLAHQGGVARVESLVDGVRAIKVPPGAGGGEVARLKGLGMPRRDGSGRGDLLVELALVGAGLRSPAAQGLAVASGDAGFVSNLKALFGLSDTPGALKLNQRIAGTRLGAKRDWDFRRLDHCLELMRLYLKRGAKRGLSPADKSELMSLARQVSERARTEPMPNLRNLLLEVNQGLVFLATASPARGPAQAHSRPEANHQLTVSYRALISQAQERLVNLFLDQYVAGIFGLPKKMMARSRLGRMLGEFFAWVEEHYQPGQNRELFIDVHVTSFVARHKAVLKTMCLNLSRRYMRQITLYHFETYLAEALTHFYRMLDAHQRQTPGMIVDLPPALTHHDGQERRKDARRPVTVPVSCSNGHGPPVAGNSVDLSQQGMRVSLAARAGLKPGDTLSCRLEPQPGQAMEMAGVVAWAGHPGRDGQEAGVHLQWSSDPRQLKLWLQVLEGVATRA